MLRILLPELRRRQIKRLLLLRRPRSVRAEEQRAKEVQP